MKSDEVSYYIVDTETSGLSHPIKAVEVAWIKIDGKAQILEEYVTKVNPERDIEPGAQAVHGISLADVANCPTIEVATTLLPADFVFIAHNLQFDRKVLSPYVNPSQGVCTLALARRWVKGPANFKLQTLKEFLGLPDELSHSALGDCRTTLGLLRVCLDLAGRELPQLVEVEQLPKIVHTMAFGKFRGKAMKDLPISYRNWLLSLPDLHKDIRYTLERLKIV